MSQDGDSTSREVDFAKQALASLSACAITADRYLRQWFIHAFNHWYCPLVLGGYQGHMTAVFDLGLVLVDAGAAYRCRAVTPETSKEEKAYIEFISQVGQSPMMVHARNVHEGTSSARRAQVERLYIESLLSSLTNVHSIKGIHSHVSLPRLEPSKQGEEAVVYPPFRGERDGRIGEFPVALDAVQPFPLTYPQPAPEIEVNKIPNIMQLFVGHVASKSASAKERLDYEVVDACLRGPNKQAAQHSPPPLRRAEMIRHNRSIMPGNYAGVTRVEVKRPEDPLIHILPSELGWVKAGSRKVENRPDWHRLAPWYHILNGKPLIYKRENPRDLIPRHRALVCFVVGEGAEGPPKQGINPRVQAYHHSYVYAKRQVFDLVRDLREAYKVLHTSVSLHVDIAVFSLAMARGGAKVYSKFDLEEMAPRRISSNVLEDRLRQTMRFHSLVPGFFDRLILDNQPPWPRQKHESGSQMAHPNIGAFLRGEARRIRRYHAVHLALVGSEVDLLTFVTVLKQHMDYKVSSRQRFTLIQVDMSHPEEHEAVLVAGEPKWSYVQTRTISEASALLGNIASERKTLQELRHQFVESVLGQVKETRSGIQREVRLVRTP